MHRIISILLTIIFLQLSLFVYILFFNTKEDNHTNRDIKLTLDSSSSTTNNLPQSHEYTIWNQETGTFSDTPSTYASQTVEVETAIEEEPIVVAEVEKPQKNIQVINRLKEDYLAVIQDSLYTAKIQNLKLLTPEQKEALRQRQEKEKKLRLKRQRKAQERISILKKIEKYAKANLGKKYVWGAVGPNKFDCSGFTRAVYRSTVGINIPRVSREQAKVGQLIRFEDLKRGDMVFFDTDKKFKKRVNHVGIYLSDGKFIHASSAKKKVIITSFKKKPFYKKRFLWGRRIVKTKS